MFKFILFDLDGTLVDTNELIIKTFQYTYKTHLKRDITEEEILEHFGEPLINTLERYAKSEEESKSMYKTYIDYNETIHDEYIRVFPGAKSTLEALKAEGCRIALVTSKRKETAIRALKLFELYSYFDEVVALEDTIKHKPNPEPLLFALSRFGAEDEKRNALMIGDSRFDILSAKNAKIKSVLVNWSMATEALGNENLVPDYTIDSLEKLVTIVKGEDHV